MNQVHINLGLSRKLKEEIKKRSAELEVDVSGYIRSTLWKDIKKNKKNDLS